MSKTRLRRASRKPLYVILALSLFIAISYVGFRTLYPPTPAGILMIGQAVPLKYGDTSVTGKLQKDTAVGVEGNYLLVLADGKLILLDIQGLDSLVGQSVTINGVLSPSTAKGLPMTMTVNSITPDN